MHSVNSVPLESTDNIDRHNNYILLSIRSFLFFNLFLHSPALKDVFIRFIHFLFLCKCFVYTYVCVPHARLLPMTFKKGDESP